MTNNQSRFYPNPAYPPLSGLTVLICTLLLAACSSGGGGDDDDDDDFDDADPTGVWTGTDARDGGSSVPMTVLVSAGGDFASISSALYLVGSGTTNGSSFTASATGYAPTGEQFANGNAVATFSLSGTAVDRVSINGSYSGANESGQWTLTYDGNKSGIGASNALVNGTYMTAAGSTITVSNGTLSFAAGSEPSCMGTGDIDFATAATNVYDWTLTLGGCTEINGSATGVGMLDNSPSGPNTRLVLLGHVANKPLALNAIK